MMLELNTLLVVWLLPLALGARRAVRLVLRQNQLKQIIEYHKIFRLFGRLHAIRPQVRYSFRLLLPDTVLNEDQI